MINKLVDAICIAINTEFGDDCEIYTESIKQGLKEPCFFVNCLNPNSKLCVKDRYVRQHQFCIQYFPQKGKAECLETHERLLQCLELISVDGDLTRGTGSQSELVEGVLNFFINYNFFVCRQSKKASMAEIESNTKIKRMV